MLPFPHRVAFLLFACACVAGGIRGFYKLFRHIQAGRADTDERTDRPFRRVAYALRTTLTQSRTFRGRPWISFFHSWIFYGFVFYILVNAVDAVDGYYPLPLQALGFVGRIYLLLADLLSGLVLAAVILLVIRRFALPSRKDFSFNARTLLHEDVRSDSITRDSLLVSTFILFHVGSRALEMGSEVALHGSDRFQPLATLLSHAISPQHAEACRVFGYWGALGSVLLFLMYFPYSKHIHIFMAPLKYAVAREVPSGVLPALNTDLDAETETLGAAHLEDLAWPRLLDAYACIQCNRCQDVCPATATGKSLSPSALEINKRMELNTLTRQPAGFEHDEPSPRPLLQFALTPEAAWACTTCGACIQVCPVQDEPMLDIIDIRRQQVLMEGKFPAQLQTAFRGMERSQNPWGISNDSRLAWAKDLNVPTVDENPEADVLYWVGCAASYDPQAQKTARSLVQLLQHASVNFAVLGKKECCTGDSARRAGNEVLYQQLAEQNIRTLNETSPKLILATCPHCMNALGKEYPQLGGNYAVMHHTEYLELLVKQGRLSAPPAKDLAVTFHDPCYLGRHNDVYDAPRNLLRILSNDVRELDRTREKSFCCGAGGAQFWKEEEPGSEKISENRLREAEQTLASGEKEKVLAVGCPFCKSMLQSSASDGQSFAVMDVAELLWAGIAGGHTATSEAALSLPTTAEDTSGETSRQEQTKQEGMPAPFTTDSIPGSTATAASASPALVRSAKRPKWIPRRKARTATPIQSFASEGASRSTLAEIETTPPAAVRQKWAPARRAEIEPVSKPISGAPLEVSIARSAEPANTSRISKRPKWAPSRSPQAAAVEGSSSQATTRPAAPLSVQTAAPPETPPNDMQGKRKKWPVQQKAKR